MPVASQGTQAFDRYAYVNNNPIMNADPSGHCSGSSSGANPIGLANYIYSCVVDISEGIDVLKSGGTAYEAAIKASGVDDIAVQLAAQTNKLNTDMGIVFSDAPIEKRIPAAINVGWTSVSIAGALVGAGQMAYRGVKSLAEPQFCRYCGKGEIDAIKETTLLRGGRPGDTYFTKDNYATVQSAYKQLALPVAPEVKINFTIQGRPTITGPSPVRPRYGQPGGGIEYWSLEPVQVIIKSITELKK